MMRDKNKVKDGTKALTKIASRLLPITKAGKADVIWSHADFGRELEKAKRIGPQKMSDSGLLSLCRGISGYYHAHFWVDACPFFRELWHRIDVGELHMSKTQACRQIGCTRQWANAIVSGRADKSSQPAQTKEAKGGKLLSAPSANAALLTNEEYIHEITKQAFDKLAPLLKDHWERYRAICKELAEHFDEASKTTPIANAQGA
jgi:hypothetical protein